jgi:DNA-binding sugar fermentation-stimulating protein
VVRALKHVQELERIAKAGEMDACLLFIVQRTDCNRLVSQG